MDWTQVVVTIGYYSEPPHAPPRGNWPSVQRTAFGRCLCYKRLPTAEQAVRTNRERVLGKLFVGGLSWDTTDDGLRTAFEAFGEVSEAKVITDRDTGRSRGFGFVTYANAEDANNAKAEMNGTELDGRTIKVDEAQGRRGGGGGARHGGF